MADLKTQIEVGMNVDGVVTGTDKAKRKISELGGAARDAGTEAGKGFASIGNGGEASAKKVESATRNMIGSIQRTTAAMEAGDKSSRQYQESLARMRGIDVNTLKPYLDQLDAAKVKAGHAATANASFASSFNGIKIAALAAAATIGAFGLFAKKILDGVDALNDLKDATGASIENISALENVARRTGAGFDVVSTSLIKLNQGLNGAKAGSDTERAIKAIGLSVSELKRLDPAEAFRQTAIALSGFADDGNKARLTQELFGKSLKEVAPLLKDLAESGSLVATVTTQQAEEAEALNKHLSVLSKTAQDAARSLLSNMVPAINSVIAAMKKGGIGAGLDELGNRLFDWEGNANRKGIKNLESDLKSLREQQSLITLDIFGKKGAIQQEIDAKIAMLASAKSSYFKLTSAAGGGRGVVNPELIDVRPTVGDLPDTAAAKAAAAAAAKALSEQNKELAEQAKLMAELAGLTGSFSSEWNSLTAIYKKGQLSLEGLTEAQGALLAKQPAIKAMHDAEAKAAGLVTKAIEEANKARQQSIDAAIKDTASLEDQIRKQQDQNASIGQSKEAIAALTAQRELDKASTLEAIAIKELDRNLDYQQYDATMAKVAAMRELASEQARGGVLQTIEDTAKAAQAEWTKFYDSIYNGLTDSLYRAFEKGGSFFKNFWDGIKNLFKTTVLKLAIQGVVGGVTGALGMSAANAATGGSGGGGYLGMASNASSLYSAGSTLTVGSQVLGGTMGIANGIGTLAANATGTGISGLLATNGAYGTAAAGSASAGMGGTMSVLSAIPVWGWAAMAVIAVAAIFGGRGDKERTGGGIEGNFGSSGFKGNSFSTWEQDGGWFHNDRTGKETGSIDAATTKQFAQAYGAVQMAAASAAVSLGLSADAVVNYSERVSLQLTDDAAANEKAVTKMFGDIGDKMATAVAPGLAALTKEGESSGAALMRLSTSLTTTNAWLDVLGHKLVEVSLAGGDAASKLADSFGGLDKMASASQSFYETYYTQAERTARSTEDMTKVLAAFGIAMPDSKEAYRDLVTGLDLTTEAGRNAYAVMLTLAPEFAATADAMAEAAKEAIGLLFDGVVDRIKSALESIATERGAVQEAMLQINAPGVMTRDAILRGIADTALVTPGNAGLLAAQAALGQADGKAAGKQALLAQAKTVAGGVQDSMDRAARAKDTAAAGVLRSEFTNEGTLTWRRLGSNPDRPGVMVPVTTPSSFDQSGYDAAVAAAVAPYQQQLSELGASQAISAAQIAAAQIALSAATAEQAAAVTAARAAQLAYIASLQDFAIDATKSAEKLGKLREETMRYYEAQKQLADLMTSSAAGLRESVRNTRMGQLDPAQSLAQQQSGFASAYSMALATSGAAQAGYADKLTAALPGLSAALMDTAGTREEWALATGALFAQSEAIARQLEANAPQNYAADSLAMLGQIDAALAVLDASSKSAEKIIADAVTAGSENTANGLRAVIAALTGKPVPAFAAGGSHAGGLRIVGEKGWEVESTGPSRIFNQQQLGQALSGGGNAELIQEVRALREEVRGLRAEAQATAGHTSKTARLLDRAMPDGDALATRVAT